MNKKWYKEAVFYHIYPLGFCDALYRNNFNDQNLNKLDKIENLIPYLRSLGINAVYLGPVFESTFHGYDTVDLFKVDSRLGKHEDLKILVQKFHENDIKVVLDAVFNHIGREHLFFQNVLQYQKESEFVNYFNNIDFSKSHFDDGFDYEGWAGYKDLVKLNLDNDDVIRHLFDAVRFWIEEFNIDGLRLDAADSLDKGFLGKLRNYTESLKEDFWLMGEVVHGDYNDYIHDEKLFSTTNYECYKGIYSSHNDKNYFEIAYSLNRLFNSDHGIYKNHFLYNFADNHDVNRLYSVLNEKRNIFNIYLMLFTIPGIPSIYYGSEFKVEGEKRNGDDRVLRPAIDIYRIKSENSELYDFIKNLIQVRRENENLIYGKYKELLVKSQQFVYQRESNGMLGIVLFNSASGNADIELNNIENGCYIDKLDNEKKYYVTENVLKISMEDFSGKLLVKENNM